VAAVIAKRPFTSPEAYRNIAGTSVLDRLLKSKIKKPPVLELERISDRDSDFLFAQGAAGNRRGRDSSVQDTV
jgi:hypothetical protein